MDKKQTFNEKNKKVAVMLLAWQFVAYGTLTQHSYYASNVHPEISSQIFFDTVKREMRSFRKANLIG